MSQILLRCLERRSSLERGENALDPESFLELEFKDENGRPDLEVSVFQIEADQWCSVCLQKMAAAGADPPRCAGGVDVTPVRSDYEDAKEEQAFRLIGDAHKVMRFADESELRTFVEALSLGMHAGVCAIFSHKKDSLRNWLHEQKEDPEWRAFLSNASEGWRKYPKPMVSDN
jgi:hypothetical protein